MIKNNKLFKDVILYGLVFLAIIVSGFIEGRSFYLFIHTILIMLIGLCIGYSRGKRRKL